MTPQLSPDGDMLYFTSTSRGDNRIKNSGDPTSEFWVSSRNDDNTWSQPEYLNINVPHRIQKDGMSVTNDRTIYFWAFYKENGKNKQIFLEAGMKMEHMVLPTSSMNLLIVILWKDFLLFRLTTVI